MCKKFLQTGIRLCKCRVVRSKKGKCVELKNGNVKVDFDAKRVAVCNFRSFVNVVFK